MYCDKCGDKIPADSRFCRFCGHQLISAIESAESNNEWEWARLSPKTVAAGVGAFIILLSLVFPWYSLRLSDASFNNIFPLDISFIDIISNTGNGGPAWIGSALPIIAVITFASFTLLNVIFNLVEDVENAKDIKFWSLLGVCSAGCIIFNAFYLLFWIHYHYGEWVNLINPGIVVAFIGAVIMIFSYALPPKAAQTMKS